MLFKRTQYIDEISYKLTMLRMELSDHNRIGLYDNNIMAENFFCTVLNILYGWKLRNANEIRKNYPGIDLLDEENKIAIQISSTATTEKIQSSIDRFLEHNPSADGFQFYMLIITAKQERYTKDFLTYGKLLFNPKTDILDSSDLLNQIKNNDTTIEQLEELYIHMEKELGAIDKKRLLNGTPENYFSLQSSDLKNRPYLFISYSHKDRTTVYPILYYLREEGLQFWFDDNLEQGDDYPEMLQSAIDESAGVLVFLSPSVNTSTWCPLEIKYALKHKKGKVVLSYLDDVELKHGLGLTLEFMHSLFLNKDNTLSDLLHELKNKFPIAFIEKKYDKQKEKQQEPDNELQILNDVKQGLVNNEFTFYLHPKYSLKEQKVIGAEALVRWISEEKGFIPPYTFLLPCIKHGFIGSLDQYIWEEVCKTIRDWIDRGYTPLPVSVNVSAEDFREMDVVEYLSKLVEKYQIKKEFLEIEISDFDFVSDQIDLFIEACKSLHDNGFKVILDDFGMGYSSLSMLKAIPIDTVKLDMHAWDFHKDTTVILIEAICKMAPILNFSVAAECVEIQNTVDFLYKNEIEYAQGYYFQKPLPVGQYELYLSQDTYE